MKSWKRQLKKEISLRTPRLREDIKNAEIMTFEKKAVPSSRRKKYFLCFGLSGLLASLVIIAFGLWLFLNPHTDIEPNAYVYSVDINPSVAFIADEEGKVKSVHSLNKDADIVLSGMSSFSGISVAEATVLFVDSAARLGYFNVSEQGDTVRINGLDEDGTGQLSLACASLQQYFCENGILGVVVEEQLSLNELCQRIGVQSAADTAQLVKQVEALSYISGENISAETDFKAEYESYVLSTQMLDFIQKAISSNLELIQRNAAMLMDISNLNARIILHQDNPSLFLKDYWSVRYFTNEEEYTADFAELIGEMETLLKEYENEFHVNLSSAQSVADAVNAYSSLSMESIINIISLTPSAFLSSPQQYLAILSNIGMDVSALEALLTLPDTAEAYSEQMNIILNTLYLFRIQEYEELYTACRPEISETDYADYIQEIIDAYGSLKNYWEIKNN